MADLEQSDPGVRRHLNDIALWRQTVQTTTGTQLADITLGNIVIAGALLLLIGFLARNLPGVLELIILQRLAVNPRAIATPSLPSPAI